MPCFEDSDLQYHIADGVTGGIGAAAVAEHFKDLMGRVMKGREFIVAIAGAIVRPLAAYSQPRAAAMPIIGYFDWIAWSICRSHRCIPGRPENGRFCRGSQLSYVIPRNPISLKARSFLI